jgi:hypothetical protein
MSCPIQQIKPHVVALVQVGVIRYSFLNIRLKKEAKYFLACIKKARCQSSISPNYASHFYH